MSAPQQGDVLLFEDNGRFTINVTGGVVEMTPGLETAVNLSLFGGNIHDDGSTITAPFSWWANRIVDDPDEKLTSQMQHLLRAIPAVTGNIPRIEGAIRADLQWLLDRRIANLINVELALPAPNTVQIRIEITADGQIHTFTFTKNWQVWTDDAAIIVVPEEVLPGPPLPPSVPAPATSGKSFRFNGIDERLQGPLLTEVEGENEGYSWALWIRYRYAAGIHIPFTLRRSDSPAGSKRSATILHVNDNGDVHLVNYDSSGTLIKDMQWNGAIPDDAMVHVAFRFVASTDVFTLLIDGIDQGVADVVLADSPGSAGGVHVRAHYFGGDFDDTLFCGCDIFSYGFWSVELTDAEFLALYNGGAFTKIDPQVDSGAYVNSAGLLYYYDFGATPKPVEQTGGIASPFIDLLTLINVSNANRIDEAT